MAEMQRLQDMSLDALEARREELLRRLRANRDRVAELVGPLARVNAYIEDRSAGMVRGDAAAGPRSLAD